MMQAPGSMMGPPSTGAHGMGGATPGTAGAGGAPGAGGAGGIGMGAASGPGALGLANGMGAGGPGSLSADGQGLGPGAQTRPGSAPPNTPSFPLGSGVLRLIQFSEALSAGPDVSSRVFASGR